MEIIIRQGGTRVKIPVLPSSFMVQDGYKIEEVNINAIGTVGIRSGRGLSEVSWDCYFPKEADSCCNYGTVRPPKTYVTVIERMMRRGPVRLQITQTSCNLKSDIVSFEWGMEDGSGNMKYSINFKEHRYVDLAAGELVQSL